MKTSCLSALFLASATVLACGAGYAQETGAPNPLLTRGGWEVGGQVAHYRYEEPGFMKLEGERVGVVGAYTYTMPNRVYSRVDLRVSYGSLEYESVGTSDESDAGNDDALPEAIDQLFNNGAWAEKPPTGPPTKKARKKATDIGHPGRQATREGVVHRHT